METLIINKRHELPKIKRIIWDGITILLWVAFIYLWKPVLIIFYKIIMSEVPPDEIADWIFDNITSVTFEHALLVLITTPIVLFILSRLNRHKSQSEHLIYHFDDYAHYFHVEETQLQECVNSQLVTVYFNEYGHIIGLENHITNNNEAALH